MKRWTLLIASVVISFIAVAVVVAFRHTPLEPHACSITITSLPTIAQGNTSIAFDHTLPPETKLLERELVNGQVASEGMSEHGFSLLRWPSKYHRESTLSLEDCDDRAFRQGLRVEIGKTYIARPGEMMTLYRVVDSKGLVHEYVIEVFPSR